MSFGGVSVRHGDQSRGALLTEPRELGILGGELSMPFGPHYEFGKPLKQLSIELTG